MRLYSLIVATASALIAIVAERQAVRRPPAKSLNSPRYPADLFSGGGSVPASRRNPVPNGFVPDPDIPAIAP